MKTPNPSREYAERRKAEYEAAVAAGRDPNDFKRNANGEILCCVYIEGYELEQQIMALIEQHQGDNHLVERVDGHISLYVDVPESKAELLLVAIRNLGCWTEDYGRINPSDIPEELD